MGVEAELLLFFGMETESWIRPFVSFLGFISQPVCRLLTTRLENQRWEQVEICSPPPKFAAARNW